MQGSRRMTVGNGEERFSVDKERRDEAEVNLAVLNKRIQWQR
jgi:hypothetical protein